MTTDTGQFRMVLRNGTLNIRSRRNGISYDDLYHDLLKLTWTRFTIWSGVAFLLINFFYGLIYFAIPAEQFEGLRHSTGWERLIESFFFSVQTIGTIGYGRMSPVGFLANCIVTLECYTGIFVVAVMTGLTFARFAKPNVRVVFSQFAVIRRFSDVPCLMFRIANERQNHLTDATVKVFLVMNDPETGYREFTDLRLERNESPLFSLSWTIAHDIDSSSPLQGLSFDALRERSAEIIVSFSGTDAQLSQSMHAKHSYVMDEILVDHDFVDVIERFPDHSVALNMDNFDKVVRL